MVKQSEQVLASQLFDRAFLVKGKYSARLYTLAPGSNQATDCNATDLRKGASMPFNSATLKKLYHDIAHLNADLAMEIRKIATANRPFDALSDTELLQIESETNHLIVPIAPASKLPPESSEA